MILSRCFCGPASNVLLRIAHYKKTLTIDSTLFKESRILDSCKFGIFIDCKRGSIHFECMYIGSIFIKNF